MSHYILVSAQENGTFNAGACMQSAQQEQSPLCFHSILFTYPSLSVKSQSTFGDGIRGDPSYRTTEAPVASAVTNQFHIIQPVCKKENTYISFHICQLAVHFPGSSIAGSRVLLAVIC